MTILISFIIGVLLSTICFKLGFAITGSYVDIKLIFIIAFIVSEGILMLAATFFITGLV